MTTQITLALPDGVYRRASHLAQLLGRDVAELLTEAMAIAYGMAALTPRPRAYALSFFPIGVESEAPSNTLPQPVAILSDTEVLALSEKQMELEQQQQLSELLDKQQAGLLTSDERSKLASLMQVYQDGLLLKAQALREAVQRGLREPLTP